MLACPRHHGLALPKARVILTIAFISSPKVLAVYSVGVFFRGLNCLSDCEAKGGLGYVFKPWWMDQAPEGYEEEPEDEPEEDYNFSHEDGY